MAKPKQSGADPHKIHIYRAAFKGARGRRIAESTQCGKSLNGMNYSMSLASAKTLHGAVCETCERACNGQA